MHHVAEGKTYSKQYLISVKIIYLRVLWIHVIADSDIILEDF